MVFAGVVGVVVEISECFAGLKPGVDVFWGDDDTFRGGMVIGGADSGCCDEFRILVVVAADWDCLDYEMMRFRIGMKVRGK